MYPNKPNKSDDSISSVKSDISILSEDSYKAGDRLTGALIALLEDNGILAVRKKLSHDAKKLAPAESHAKSVGFQYASAGLKTDYTAYKAEVAKIKPVKDAYQVAHASAKFATDLKSHMDCLAAARSWKDQAVKARSMRIRFLQIHQKELEKHFDTKSLKDHIKQGEANLNSANDAFKAIERIESRIIKLSGSLPAAN